MNNVSMLTVVPAKLALDMCANKVLKNFNTLPRVNNTLLETVREFMRNNVGYADLPMACLVAPKSDNNNIAETVQQYLPINSKDSVLFQLDMPDDMIVAMNYRQMLELSNELDHSTDKDTIEFIQEDVMDALSLGLPSDPSECIFFIPFLAADKCKFYAKFDNAFSTEEFNLPGIEKMTITELSAFYR